MSPPHATGAPHSLRGIACGLAAATIWSGWYVLARHGVTQGGLDPYDLAALRFMVAAPILLLILRRLPFSRSKFPLALIMALGAGPLFVIVVGVGFLSAPAKFGGAVAAAFGVLFTLAGGFLVLGERLTGRQWAGMCCALAGLALLALTAGASAGIWPFILGGLLWAAYSIAFRKSGLSALEAVASVALLAALIYLPVYFLMAGGRMWSVDPAQLVLQAVGQGILTGIVALWFHARAVDWLGAMKAALFQSLVPALTLIIAFLALGERPTAIDIVAIGVILAGIYGALRYGEVRKTC